MNLQGAVGATYSQKKSEGHLFCSSNSIGIFREKKRTTVSMATKAAKITSKADVLHMDGMRVGGHVAESNRGVATSISTVVANILKAGKDQGLKLDESTVRLVAEQEARSRLDELLAVNREKYDFKYNTFMHNHGAQLLIAFYRLGADGSVERCDACSNVPLCSSSSVLNRVHDC